MAAADISLLKKVLSLPTAPFHEEAVISFIIQFCKKLRLKIRQDRFGNLKVVYKKGKRCPISFLAHMDHPGFEVIQGGRQAVVELLGGVPDKYFKGSRVVVCSEGRLFSGKIIRIKNKKKRQFFLKADQKILKKNFGYFDLPPFKKKNGKIYTKAADNLVSVAVLLNLLQELVLKKQRAHVCCHFTRAEEVGFVGAIGALQNAFISKKVPILVLEASSVKGGPIVMGNGPVLRVGDRRSTFSNAIDLGLRSVAENLKKKEKSFCYQRALLAGGSCEATLLASHGFDVGCLAFPLGHYHNTGPKNYAAEFISEKDYKNMLQWLQRIAAQKKSILQTGSLKKQFQKTFRRLGPRLLT